MELIAVATPELVDAISELSLMLPDNPVVEFLSRVQAGDMIVSEPRRGEPA